VRRDGVNNQSKRRNGEELQSQRDRPATNKDHARGRYKRTRSCGHSGEQRGHCIGPYVRQSRIRSAYRKLDQRQSPWTNLGELGTAMIYMIPRYFCRF